KDMRAGSRAEGIRLKPAPSSLEIERVAGHPTNERAVHEPLNRGGENRSRRLRALGVLLRHRPDSRDPCPLFILRQIRHVGEIPASPTTVLPTGAESIAGAARAEGADRDAEHAQADAVDDTSTGEQLLHFLG